MDYGIWSLMPLVVAISAAFWTRSAAFSLFLGCLVGAVMVGMDPIHGLNSLAQKSLGNEDFIWICIIVLFIGILFELFKKAGVIGKFAEVMAAKAKIGNDKNSHKKVGFFTWLIGFFIIDDYFSPLMTGPIMRPMTDKAKMSREKLAFILDSTTASVCVLIPFSAWGAYVASLILAEGGSVKSQEQAIEIFIHSIGYNFYPILLVIFTLLIVLKIIPDFGPMRKAEKRAWEEGKLLRDGAQPLISEEADEVDMTSLESTSLIWDLLVPALIIVMTVVGTYSILGKVMIAEAFIAAVFYLSIKMTLMKQIKNIAEATELAMKGVKSVMPAIMIMALAYIINGVTKDLGAAKYIIDLSRDSMTPSSLVALTFILTAAISFSTGTSWGAYALMVPFVLPYAYDFTGGVAMDAVVYQVVGAVVGGGIFGDHASPVSDTSVLSSVGAGSDHMDHVYTQLPYALLIGSITVALYWVI